MSFIQKFFTSRNRSDSDDFVGQPGRLWFDEVDKVIFYSDGVTPGGFPVTGSNVPAVAEVTFETLAKNLKSYPYVINRTDAQITSIVYTLPSSLTITKTLNYTDTRITSITISGPAIPNTYTKFLAYLGADIVSASYTIL